MPRNQIKGTALVSLQEVAKQAVGSHGWAEVLGHLGPQHELCEQRTVASSWYDVSTYLELHRAIQHVAKGTPTARTLGGLACRHDLSGVYRVFVRTLSPAAFMSVVPRFFGQYFRFGKMAVEHHGPGGATAKWTDCFGFDEHLWSDVVGHGEAGLELCGARNVRLHVLAGGGPHDTFMTVRGHWT